MANNNTQIGRLCSNRACQRRVSIPIDNIFSVSVASKGGGSRLDAAFDCPRCGDLNTIPATHLPKGMPSPLQTRKRWLQKQAITITEQSLASPSRHDYWQWSTGRQAAQNLEQALKCVEADKLADFIILAPTDNGLEDITGNHPHLKQNASQKPARFLKFLDDKGAELMIIGGKPKPDGHPWRMIFSPQLGTTQVIGRT